MSLASANRSRAPKPLLIYAIMGIMVLSAFGEITNAIRSSPQIQMAGSLVPILLFGVAAAGAMFVYRHVCVRSERLRKMPPMPVNEQELVLQEEGWHVTCTGDRKPTLIRPWRELREQRTGRRALIVRGPGSGLVAVPLRVLSTAQGDHLHRLLTRKLRPSHP